MNREQQPNKTNVHRCSGSRNKNDNCMRYWYYYSKHLFRSMDKLGQWFLVLQASKGLKTKCNKLHLKHTCARLHIVALKCNSTFFMHLFFFENLWSATFHSEMIRLPLMKHSTLSRKYLERASDLILNQRITKGTAVMT